MTRKWIMALGVSIGLLLIALLAVEIAASAPTSGASLPSTTNIAEKPARTITVAGSGTASARPNLAQATIGVEVTAPTVTEATQHSHDNMAAVIARLKALGIADKDIQTINYSIAPERNPAPNGATQPSGYRSTETARVTIRDLNQIGTLLDQATQAGANIESGIAFELDPTAQQQVEAEARTRAVADAQDRATALAKLNNVQRGEVVSISEVPNAQPIPLAYEATNTAASAGPIQPGNLEMHVQVQVTYAIQ